MVLTLIVNKICNNPFKKQQKKIYYLNVFLNNLSSCNHIIILKAFELLRGKASVLLYYRMGIKMDSKIVTF